MQPIQLQLYQNQKKLSQFFVHFRNLQKIANTFKKNLSLRGHFLLKL